MVATQSGPNADTMYNGFFKTNVSLILASASPRRQDFLKDIGLHFSVQTAGVDEQLRTNETPNEFVSRLSLAKAKAVALDHKDAWVIGADTVVAIDHDILGKPTDPSEALKMLRRLNGNWHEVWTSFAIYCDKQAITIQKVVKTRVKFWQHPEEVLLAYLETKESMDKAGAYGIQGQGGLLIEKIEGSYSNVVGLPLAELINILLDLDLVCPGRGSQAISL